MLQSKFSDFLKDFQMILTASSLLSGAEKPYIAIARITARILNIFFMLLPATAKYINVLLRSLLSDGKGLNFS